MPSSKKIFDILKFIELFYNSQPIDALHSLKQFCIDENERMTVVFNKRSYGIKNVKKGSMYIVDMLYFLDIPIQAMMDLLVFILDKDCMQPNATLISIMSAVVKKLSLDFAKMISYKAVLHNAILNSKQISLKNLLPNTSSATYYKVLEEGAVKPSNIYSSDAVSIYYLIKYIAEVMFIEKININFDIIKYNFKVISIIDDIDTLDNIAKILELAAFVQKTKQDGFVVLPCGINVIHMECNNNGITIHVISSDDVNMAPINNMCKKLKYFLGLSVILQPTIYLNTNLYAKFRCDEMQTSFAIFNIIYNKYNKEHPKVSIAEELSTTCSNVTKSSVIKYISNLYFVDIEKLLYKNERYNFLLHNSPSVRAKSAKHVLNIVKSYRPAPYDILYLDISGKKSRLMRYIITQYFKDSAKLLELSQPSSRYQLLMSIKDEMALGDFLVVSMNDSVCSYNSIMNGMHRSIASIINASLKFDYIDAPTVTPLAVFIKEMKLRLWHNLYQRVFDCMSEDDIIKNIVAAIDNNIKYLKCIMRIMKNLQQRKLLKKVIYKDFLDLFESIKMFEHDVTSCERMLYLDGRINLRSMVSDSSAITAGFIVIKLCEYLNNVSASVKYNSALPTHIASMCTAYTYYEQMRQQALGLVIELSRDHMDLNIISAIRAMGGPVYHKIASFGDENWAMYCLAHIIGDVKSCKFLGRNVMDFISKAKRINHNTKPCKPQLLQQLNEEIVLD